LQNLDKTPLIVDFVGGAVGHRLRSGEGRKQDLARAIGFAGGINPDVVDATAGLGRDAFFLASLGARVTLIERSPVMHALLADGIEKAREAGGRYA
jgi:16S rRNA (guanine1516-N2)-methyltransferase